MNFGESKTVMSQVLIKNRWPYLSWVKNGKSSNVARRFLGEARVADISQSSVDVFSQAAKMAEKITLDIEERCPELFNQLEWIDLRPAFRFNLTFLLARKELVPFFEVNNSREKGLGLHIFKNSLMSPESFSILGEDGRNGVSSYFIEGRSDNMMVPIPSIDPQNISKFKSLFFLGGEKELKFLSPMVTDKSLFIPKKDSVVFAVDNKVKGISISQGIFSPVANLYHGFIDQVIKKTRDKFVLRHLNEFKPILIQAFNLKFLLETTEATLVSGCLEKSPLGPLLSGLKINKKPKLVNIQHGNIGLTYTMGLSSFDAFLCWNQLSKEQILLDGYPNESSLHVVGNPLWASVENKNQGSKMILALDQPPKTPSITFQTERAFLQLVEFLSDGFEINLRLHPVRKGSQTTTLADDLCRAGLIITVHSAALYEALLNKKPVILFDPFHRLSGVGTGLERYLPVARTQDEVVEMIDKYLQNSDQFFSDYSVKALLQDSKGYSEKVSSIVGQWVTESQGGH